MKVWAQFKSRPSSSACCPPWTAPGERGAGSLRPLFLLFLESSVL